MIKTSVVQRDNLIQITVTDNGPGIDTERIVNNALGHGLVREDEIEKMTQQEKLSLIFQPKVSVNPLDNTVSRQGLGLFICKQKAEEMGGTISVYSEAGKGTCFTVKIPH